MHLFRACLQHYKCSVRHGVITGIRPYARYHLPRVFGGDFAAARRLLSSGSRRGRLILVSGLDSPFIFIFEPLLYQ